jgi:hypothetical protein
LAKSHRPGRFNVENKNSSRSLFSRPKKHSRAETKPHLSKAAAALTEASGFNNQGERHQQWRAALTKAGGFANS